jgi:MFS family permease
LILLAEAVVKLVLFLPAGLLVDRWGRTASLTAALVISTLVTPLFVVLSGLTAILLVRAVIAVAFVLAIPACMALMADLVPRSVRGQMMAAIGQGGIILGSVGSPGGPAVGYLIIPPLMVASLAGGFLYTLNPVYPWIFSVVAGLLSILLTVLYIRDPQQAEP